MKELKFRAWSNENNRYCDFVTLDESRRWIGWIKSSGVYLTTTDISLEQYTGLKDENGKEVYEGDIVTLNGEWEVIKHDDCYLVTFENGCFRVGDGYENEAGSYLSDWRVIGNVHENSELLERE